MVRHNYPPVGRGQAYFKCEHDYQGLFFGVAYGLGEEDPLIGAQTQGVG